MSLSDCLLERLAFLLLQGFLGCVVVAPVVELSANELLEGIVYPGPDGDVPLKRPVGATAGTLEDDDTLSGTVTLLGMTTTGSVGMEGLEVAVSLVGTEMLAGMVTFRGAGVGVGVGVTSTELEVGTTELLVVRLRAAVEDGKTKSEVLLETMLLLIVIEELGATLVLL